MTSLDWQAPNRTPVLQRKRPFMRCGLYQCMIAGCDCIMFEGDLDEPCENCGHREVDHFND